MTDFLKFVIGFAYLSVLTSTIVTRPSTWSQSQVLDSSIPCCSVHASSTGALEVLLCWGADGWGLERDISSPSMKTFLNFKSKILHFFAFWMLVAPGNLIWEG